MKYLKYLTFLSILSVLSPVGVFARDNNQHSVDIPTTVQVGGTQLKPGNYKVNWQGAGPDIQVTFLRNGKTVATVPATEPDLRCGSSRTATPNGRVAPS
jgi:hypothetical protein